MTTPTIKLRIVFSGKPPEALPTLCSLCSRSFSSVKALHGHMRSHRNNAPPPPPSIPPRPTDLIHSRPHPPPPLSWSRAAKKRTPRVPVGPHLEMFDAGKEEQSPSDESCTDVAGAVASWQEEYPGALEQRRQTSEPSEARPSCSTRSSEPPSPVAPSFACSPSCGKTFSSYHALCGHMATHRKKQRQHEPLSARKCYCCYYAPPPAAMSKMIKKGVKRAKSAAEHHSCKVCGKVFPTGQALGGHKRLHREGSSYACTTLLLPPAAAAAAAAPPGDSTWGKGVAPDLRELLLLV